MTRPSRRPAQAAAAVIATAALAVPLTARAAPDPALQAEVQTLRETVDQLQARIKALEAKLGETDAAAPAGGPTPVATAGSSPHAGVPTQTAANQANPQPSPGRRSPVVAAAPIPRDTIGDEMTGVARPNTAPPPNNPELKGFIAIPGTDTMIKLGGFAKVNAIYDLSPAGNSDKFVTSTIPFDTHDRTEANLGAEATRFSFEVRRPSSLGPLRFYLENDFYGGSGSIAFRLRQAHGQVGNTYAGYGYSAFMDSDAFPETLDDEGPGGEAFVRLVSVRQLWTIRPDLTVTVSVEDPASDLTLASGQTASQSAPDATVAFRYEKGWGHVQLAGLVRDLGYRSATADDSALGYGVSLAGLVRVGGDFLMGAFTYGDGIGRYFNDINGKGYDGVVAANGDLRPLTSYGGYAGYTHHWNKRWRSSLVGGGLVLDNDAALPMTAFKSSTYVAGNVIWQVSSSFIVGLEALYGHHELQNGQSADATRLQASIKYDFVK